MFRFGPRTIRAKLTLVTMLVMGGLLGGFGVSVDLLAREAVMHSIDDDLTHRAQFMSRGPLHWPGGHGGPPDFDRGNEHGPGHGPDDHGPMGPPPDGFGPDHDQVPWNDHPGTSPATTNGKVETSQVTIPTAEPGQTAQRQLDAATTAPVPPPQFFKIGQSNPRQVSLNPEAFATAKASGHLMYTTIFQKGTPIRLITYPTVENGKVVRISEISSPLEETFKTLDGVHRVLITIIIPAGVVLSGLASLYLVGRLTKPLRVINSNAASIGAHNAAERLPVVGQDEFASVSTTLNGMLDRLEAGLRLEQMTNRQLEQTVIQQRRFTEDASHELKTPLAVIKANTGLMLHFGGDAEETRESALSIEAAANRMNQLVQDLLVLARAEAGQLAPRFESIDLRTVLQNSVNQLPSSPNRVSIVGPPEELIVSVSADDLSRVFVNLIDNAIRHSGSDSPVEVTITRKKDRAVVTVRDRGTGIAAEHLPRLFDRFYRIDRSRSSDTGGTGLGLAICKGIVEAHKGTIEVASAPGQGTTFTVSLPAS